MKICKKCKIAKPIEEFSKHSITKDGLSYNCKQCVKDEHKKKSDYYISKTLEWRKKNKEAIKLRNIKKKTINKIEKIVRMSEGANPDKYIDFMSCSYGDLKRYISGFFDEKIPYSKFKISWNINFKRKFEEFDLTKEEELNKITNLNKS
jgi:hypothetical protein